SADISGPDRVPGPPLRLVVRRRDGRGGGTTAWSGAGPRARSGSWRPGDAAAPGLGQPVPGAAGPGAELVPLSPPLRRRAAGPSAVIRRRRDRGAARESGRLV